MTSIEHLLVGLDSKPWSYLWRLLLGVCIPPVFRMLTGDSNAAWPTIALFLCLLVLLRVVPAILRMLAPFSAEAKEIWRQRRFLSKEFDSYQWQKLFWVGLGLLTYAAVGSALRNGELVVAVICLAGGGAGLVLWRKNGVGAESAPT